MKKIDGIRAILISLASVLGVFLGVTETVLADGVQNGGAGVYSEYTAEVEAPEEGLYEITVEYVQPEDNVRDITIDVQINGELPFPEAVGITLPRIYKNDGDIRKDANGNEIAPRQIMVLDPVAHTLMNTSGFYEGNYQFPLVKGKNEIRLQIGRAHV